MDKTLRAVPITGIHWHVYKTAARGFSSRMGQGPDGPCVTHYLVIHRPIVRSAADMVSFIWLIGRRLEAVLV